MKFKRTTISTTPNGELMGMTWSWGRWSVVMRHCHGQGTWINYEKSWYDIALSHSTIIDHMMNMPTLRIQSRTAAIMAVMWLVNRLSQVRSKEDGRMAIHWRQLMRDLAGDVEADKKITILAGVDHVRRVYRQMQELKREHSD